MSIKSKIHNYGHKDECSWPPKYPKNPRRVVKYIDSETGELKEGYPPNRNNNFGVAPMVIFDSMPKTYHEKAGRDVESRSEWERLDRETGAMTFSSTEESRRYITLGVKKEEANLKKDRRKTVEEAVQMVRANPTEIRQKLDKQAEIQHQNAKKSGLDKLLESQGIKI